MDRRTLWRRLSQRPRSVSFNELERLLLLSGFEHHHTTGSHYIYRRGADRISVPYRRATVLPVYVREALKLTKEAEDDD